MSQGELVSYLVEERLHAIDSVEPDRAISQTVAAFYKGGSVYETAMDVAKNDGAFGKFLKYPMSDKEFFDTTLPLNKQKDNEDRVAAELFARIGVIYAYDPDLAEKVFPQLKGVYDVASVQRSNGQFLQKVSASTDKGASSGNNGAAGGGDFDALLANLGGKRHPTDPRGTSSARSRVIESLGTTRQDVLNASISPTSMEGRASDVYAQQEQDFADLILRNAGSNLIIKCNI
jgi:hypothetical protein